MADPIDPQNALLRGFRRIHADGSSPPGEYIEPYGYVVPKGRCLIVTDLAFFSAFTDPEAAGNLTRLVLGYLNVVTDGWTQGVIFVTTPVFSQNGAIGGNVTMRTGFVIPYGRYLTLDLFDSELVETEVFVYSYLADLAV